MAYGIVFEFLDVGMGDGTLVQLPPWDSGPLWLVDFGEKCSPYKLAVGDALTFLITRISEVCKKRNLLQPELEMLAISHADGDHWNKLDWLIEGKNVETGASDLWHTIGGWPSKTTLKANSLLFGGDWEGDYEKRNKTLADLIWGACDRNWNLPNSFRSRKNQDGSVIPFKIYNQGVANLETKIYLLSSNRPKKIGHDCNPKSLVLMFEYDNSKVILAGDAESKVVEPNIIAYYDAAFLDSYALKMGHHGSDGASSKAFLEKIVPAAIFASGDRRWGHPYCSAIQRVIDLGSLRNIANHRYVCSLSGSDSNTNDYDNRTTTQQICTNLWYLVKGFPSETLDGKTEIWGTYTGVQWRLQLDPGKAAFFSHTEQWPSP
jgi:competence protein ComEC